MANNIPKNEMVNVHIDSYLPVNLKDIDNRIEHNGIWLKSWSGQAHIQIPKDCFEDVLEKLHAAVKNGTLFRVTEQNNPNHDSTVSKPRMN